jgi:hypothetical protein
VPIRLLAATEAEHAMLHAMNRLDRAGLAVLILAVLLSLFALIVGSWLVAIAALLLAVSMVLRQRSLWRKDKS